MTLSLSIGAALPAAADVWEKSYRIGGTPELELVTDDSSVDVEPWDRKEIHVRVTTVGWRLDGNEVRIAGDQHGNRVELQVRTGRRFVIFWTPHSVRVEVRLPREAEVNIQTGDGSVSMRGLSGTATVHTGDGRILVDEFHGNLSLNTGDGGIRAMGFEGALRAHTGDGRIRVDGRFESLELSSGDGSITAEASKGSRIASPWTLSTGDGPLMLRIPNDLRADLDAHTNDGGIDVELPVEVSGNLGRSSIRGRLNGGGPLLRLRSGDGSIRIEGL